MRRLALVLLLLAACGGGGRSAATTTSAAQSVASSAPSAEAPIVLIDTSGATKTNTDDFTVDGKWTIAVEVTGGVGVSVDLKDPADGRTIDFVNFETSGESTQRRSGTFFLQIAPFGSSYHLTVTDIPG